MNEAPVLDGAVMARLREWGGEELPRRMIEIFLSHTPPRMTQIRDGLAEGDPKRVEAGAHSLKSSAANLGATRLQRILQEMETLAGKQELESLEKCLPGLEEAFSAAWEALRNLMEGMDR
ncbi:MAG: Hpt domain-containing protein [Longimicrobiales bacterium]